MGGAEVVKVDTNTAHTRHIEEVLQKIEQMGGIDKALKSVGGFVLHYQSTRDDVMRLRGKRDELERENRGLRSALAELQEARARPEGEGDLGPITVNLVKEAMENHPKCPECGLWLNKHGVCERHGQPTPTPPGDALAEAVDKALNRWLMESDFSSDDFVGVTRVALARYRAAGREEGCSHCHRPLDDKHGEGCMAAPL
jgi:hypothetical protein